MYPLPSPGSDSSITQRASVWRDIFTMLNQWRRGDFTRKEKPPRAGTIWIKNNTGRDVEAGELLQISSMTQPADTSLGIGTNYSPMLTAVQPTWHAAIDNIVISDGPILDGEMFAYRPRSYGIVACSGDVGSDLRYIMPDPTNTKYGMRTSSGIFKVLGYDSSNDFAIVDTTVDQTLWRYELTQASQSPSTTTAKLVDLGGTDFASSVTITDDLSIIDDQASGEKGYCLHVGNKFYAIQAPC